MKSKSIFSLCGASTSRQSNLILAAALLALLGGQFAHAVDIVWSGLTSQALNVSGNWVGSPTLAPTTDVWVFDAAGPGGTSLTDPGGMVGMTFNVGAPAYTLGTTANNIIWAGPASPITNNSSSTQTLNMGLAMGTARTFTGTGSFIVNGALTGNGNIGKKGTGNLTITGTANTLSNTISVTETGTLTFGAVGDVGAKNLGTGLGGNFNITNATLAATPGIVTSGGNSSIQRLSMNAGSKFTMADGFFNTFEVTSTTDLFKTTGIAPVYTFNLGSTSSADVLALTLAPSFSFAGPKINITPVSALTIGNSYTVVTAAGGGLDNANGFVLETGVAVFGNTAYTLSITNSATSTSIGVLSADLAQAFYSGAQGTTLNAGTPGVSTNWLDAASGGTDTLIQPSAVTQLHFAATGATNTTIATLGQDYTAFSLNFNDNAGSVSINDTGSNKITLGVGGINVAAGSHSINVPLALSAAQAFTNSGPGLLTIGGDIDGGVSPLTLTLAGTGSTTISSIVSGSSALSVNPSATDTGTVTLSGDNTYTGGVTLLAGALTLQNDQSAADGGISVGTSLVANSTLTIDTGATVALASGSTFQVGSTGTTGATGITATANVAGDITNAGALRVGRIGILNLTSGATWLQEGDMTIQGAGNITAQMTIGTGASLTYDNDTTIKVQPPTGNFFGVSRLTISGILTTNQGFEAVVDATGTATGQVEILNGTIKLSASIPNLFLADGVGVDATKLLVTSAGTIDTNGFNTTIAQVIKGAGGSLIKDSAGTLTLTAANTYTGNTTVNAGTLDIVDNAQLRFITGATSGTGNNVLSGAGTVTLNGDFFIDTAATDASALASGSWQIENAASLPGAYGIDFTVVGWTDAGSNTWTTSVGTKNYTFNELNGTVSMIDTAPPADPYAAWIATYEPNALLPDAASKLPGADPDGDDYSNLMEFVLDGSPVVSSQSIRPNQTVNATDIILTFKRSDASESPVTTQMVQISTDLVDWTTIPAITIGAGDNLPSVGVAENGAAADDITVTIPRSGSLKKFVRLNVVK
jgi:autotransporter-associated beta strand protein